MTLALTELIEKCQDRVEQVLQQYLRENISHTSHDLQAAMAYAALNGGKRIRPLLVYATGLSLGATFEDLDAAACAIELIHAYSLIHDDLPAMDNADVRRGKPACHIAYGEALAILAGDALQTLAFTLLSTHPAPNLTAEQRLAMVAALAEASGLAGIAGGQALDMANHFTNTLNNITTLYHLKTGVMLVASVKLALLAAQPKALALENNLIIYAQSLGLAFQLQDDLLDIEGNNLSLGKPQGLDAKNDKATYPVLAGINETKAQIDTLITQALAAIANLGSHGRLLQEYACYLLKRQC